jgi:hypothetical protein
VYQSAVRGSCDDRTTGMFGEATMAQPWEGMGKAVMGRIHKA